MQSIFSSLEQEILKPVYAIYPWSPDMEVKLPADERDRFEKALFAKAGTGENDRDAILKQAIRQFAEAMSGFSRAGSARLGATRRDMPAWRSSFPAQGPGIRLFAPRVDVSQEVA